MAIYKPTPLSAAPPMREEALKLALDFAQARLAVAITKFRYLVGGSIIILSVVLFVASASLDVDKHFREDFPEHAWLASIALFFAGLALCGDGIINGVVGALKSAGIMGDGSKSSQ